MAEAALFERWLDNRNNDDIRDALANVQMKIAAIQSWFNLLNADELFVIQKHMIDQLDWPRVALEFTERWKSAFVRSDRTLIKYQNHALKKITSFCTVHREITLALFGDLLDEGAEMRRE